MNTGAGEQHGRVKQYVVYSGLSILAAAGAVCAQSLRIPAAWIFSFLLVFGTYALCANRPVTPPQRAFIPAQVVIALLCAAPLAKVRIADIFRYAFPSILSVGLTLIVCLGAAWWLIHVLRVKADTAILSTMAGGASAMVMLARDLGADVRFVILSQYLRLSLVVLTLPAWVSLLRNTSGENAKDTVDIADTVNTVSSNSYAQTFINTAKESLVISWGGIFSIICAWGIIWLILSMTRKWITIPSPYLLMGIVVGIIFALIGGISQPEGVIVDVAYALIGIQAGGALTMESLRYFSTKLPGLVGAIAIMIFSSLGMAYVISAIWNYSVLDAYLATVPGGIYAVLAFAHEAGSDPIVTVVQTVRVIAMLIVGAYAPIFLTWLMRRSKHSQ